jgi:hypothetical protein
MMRRRFIVVANAALVLLLTVAAVASEDWQYTRSDNEIQQATIGAVGRGPTNTVEANFRLFCSPGKGAGLFLEGEVLNADSLKGFNFADFEGPDAPFGQNRLATLTLGSARGSVTVHSSGAGWYSETNQFKFSVGLDRLPGGEKAKVRKALRGDVQVLELTLYELKNPRTQLVMMAEGQWKSDALRRVVAACEHS